MDTITGTAPTSHGAESQHRPLVLRLLTLSASEIHILLRDCVIPEIRRGAISLENINRLTRTGVIELCKEERGLGSTRAVVFKFFKKQDHYSGEKAAHKDSHFDPNLVVSVLDYHDGDGAAFQVALRKHHPGGADLNDYPRAFVMEAADRNLEQIHQSERLDEAAVAEGMRQVAAALVSVHAKGMMLGDLKHIFFRPGPWP